MKHIRKGLKIIINNKEGSKKVKFLNFSKNAKKMVKFQKKNTLFVSLLGGDPDLKVENSTFFNPSQNRS